jgi:hypothetical protein
MNRSLREIIPATCDCESTQEISVRRNHRHLGEFEPLAPDMAPSKRPTKFMDFSHAFKAWERRSGFAPTQPPRDPRGNHGKVIRFPEQHSEAA